MASAYAESWADASADLDAEFGEAFELTPTASAVTFGAVADPNARPSLSALRGPVAFVGIFFDKGSVIHATGRAMADSTTRSIIAEKPMIDVDRTQFQGDLLRGDIVRQIDPPRVFEVTAFVVDDLNRAWVHLAERRGPGAHR